MENEYFTVGVIANVHGLRGEVKVLSRTDFDELRFHPKSRLFVRSEGSTPTTEVVVKTARRHQQFWLVSFEGMSSINDVERWKGMQLCVHQSQLPPLPEGTYYMHELIGLSVYTDDGRFAGELVDVLTPGANDVYVIRGPLQAKELLIPATKECVLSVDRTNGRMTIHVLAGLLEEEDSES